MSHQKGFAHILIVIFITVIAAGVVGAAWYYEENKDEVVETNTNVATNTNIVSNTNTVISETFMFPDALVGTSCVVDDDCRIADVTDSVGDCCPTPSCVNWYTSDDYIAVNSDSYSDERANLSLVNKCEMRDCEQLTPPYCPPGNPYAKATCKNNKCIKVYVESDSTKTNTAVDETAGWQTYTNDEYGFSLEFPTAYKATETQNRLILFSYLFEYPLDLTRGVHVGISQKTTEEPVNAILVKDDPKNIGGEIWQAYTYDPKNDPSATDQSKGIQYILEKEERTFTITIPVEISWPTYISHTGEEIQGMTVEEVDANIAKMLSTFQFTD